LDVKSIFLNGVLNEEIYVEQSDGFEKEITSNKVCLLKKALYGLKQTPKAWYSRLNSHLLSLSFERSMNEAVLYMKYVDKHKLIESMYVDDLLIIGNNEQLVEEFEANIKDKFEMNELGFLTYFLGIKVTRSVQGYLLCQKRFTLKLLNKFAMENCKLVSIPMVLG